jgi:hypothetical protein
VSHPLEEIGFGHRQTSEQDSESVQSTIIDTGHPVFATQPHLIQGCRFEACGTGGAILGSDSAMLMNNRFEQNVGNGGVGIMIQSSASRTRLISNLLSANSLINQGSQTQSFGAITDP